MKFMNLKRFASTTLAGVMALSLAVPAFASNTTVIEATYEEVPISVSVPTTGTAQINPYGLPVTLTKSDKTTAKIVDEQITTRPMSIKNQGDIPLSVDATLAVIPKGDVVIASSASTDKTIEVTLEVAELNDSALAVDSGSKTLEDLLVDRFVNEATWDGAGSADAPAAAKGAKAADITPTVETEIATIGAATVNGKTITYGPKSIALVRLTGALAESPVDADSKSIPWKTSDGFTANVVFTFKPADKTNVTVSVTGTATTNPPSTLKGYEGETITFTFSAASGKNCTGAITGMDGVAPTVTITETGSTGNYTGTFTMPADDPTPGIALAITIPA